MTSTEGQNPSVHGSVLAHADHDVPTWVLVAVFVALLVLTAMTVAVTRVDLGSFNVWIALSIATIKAVLVALFFMHLAYEKVFNTVVLLCTLFFVVFFIALATLDVHQYRGDIDTFRTQHPDRVVPQIDQAPSGGHAISTQSKWKRFDRCNLVFRLPKGRQELEQPVTENLAANSFAFVM
jgi:cytochrome c oxidase subunit 4